MTVRMLRSISIAVAASCLAAAAHAQPSQPLDTPPRLPATADEAAAQRPATTQRQVIRLPESDSAREAAPRARDDAPLAKAAAQEQLPPLRQTSPEARIEQRRRANRVVEVIVTPANSTTSYMIVNREGARPLSQQELSAGLSVPRFLQLKF